MIHRFFTLLFIAILMLSTSISRSFAQSAAKYTISGYIKDTANGESLIAATVAIIEVDAPE